MTDMVAVGLGFQRLWFQRQPNDAWRAMAIPHVCCFYGHIGPDSIGNSRLVMHCVFTSHEWFPHLLRHSLHSPQVVQSIAIIVLMPSSKHDWEHFFDCLKIQCPVWLSFTRINFIIMRTGIIIQLIHTFAVLLLAANAYKYSWNDAAELKLFYKSIGLKSSLTSIRNAITFSGYFFTGQDLLNTSKRPC